MFKKLLAMLNAKEKPVLVYLVMLGAVGVLLLVVGNGFFFSKPAAPEENALAAVNTAPSLTEALPGAGEPADLFSRELALEQRLENAFSMMENVGKVRVVVSLAPEQETVYAKDESVTESVTRETDSQGGTRETRSQSRQDETIMLTDTTGTDRPLVLREIEQEISGAVIIAEGGDNVFVKDALTKAACTILGVEANKVQVLKMKK